MHETSFRKVYPTLVLIKLAMPFFFNGALFPELYEDTLSELPKSSRWTFLGLACTLDVKIISLAKENGLPYDRSWLLYWLPKSGEAIRPQDYVTILYHASFMPPDHRGIIDQGYEIGGFVPSYIMERVRSWDTRFRMNSLGYVFDVFSAEWILDPIAAELSIPFLREELARYLGR